VTKTYDLVIIGTGTAAQVTSARVRAAGWKVAVMDHRPFGGTCALRGCDPIQYEVYLDPGFWVPQALVRHSLRKDLPAVLEALRTRVEGLDAARR
jgi:glutathione reductase (NADPH)